MLIYIADSIKKLFGTDDTYRIGGDEFVVFCKDCSEEEVQNRLSRLLIMMEERAYHISIGKAWLNDCTNINDTITVAEADMYEVKRLYYKKIEDASEHV